MSSVTATETWDEVAHKLSNLQPFIQYLIETGEDEWATGVVRTKDGKNCLFGHLVKWHYGEGYEGSISRVWDVFESMWMSTYVIYRINDGEHQGYPQSTPKQRVIMYIKNLWLGVEVDMQTGWAQEAASCITQLTTIHKGDQ